MEISSSANIFIIEGSDLKCTFMLLEVCESLAFSESPDGLQRDKQHCLLTQCDKQTWIEYM